ncbi:MAG: hypothetical protein ABL930_02305 [Pseudobdellovibrio sp.]
MGSNALVSILFFFAGVYVFASDIPFNELIQQGAIEQQRLAAADISEPQEDPIYLNVQKKDTTTAQLDIEENNDGLKIVLKKKTKKKKKKKPASVSSPIIVPINNN